MTASEANIQEVEALDQAEVLFQKGNLGEASLLCQQVFKRNPKNDRALNILSLIALRANNLPLAKQTSAAALSLVPDNPGYLTNAGLIALTADDQATALQYFLKAGQLFFQSIDTNKANIANAIESFAQVTHIDTGHFAAHKALGRLYQFYNDFVKSTHHLEQALLQSPEDLELLQHYIYALIQQGKYEAALRQCDTALKTYPEAPAIIGHKALILEGMNNLEEAETVLQTAAAANIHTEEIAYLSAKVKRRSKRQEDALAILQSNLLKNSRNPYVHFERGTLLEKQGNYEQAFQAFSQAQEAQKATPEYELCRQHTEDRIIQASLEWFENHTLAPSAETPPSAEESPVFLLGFPRSGTTLTEQIIATHSDIIASQEVSAFSRMIHQEFTTRQIPYPDILNQLDEAAIRSLRAQYWNLMREHLKQPWQEGKRLLDKLPLNTVYLGLIHRLFPNARIIFALRDPRDVLLSCYTQVFQMNASMIHFLSLETAVDFYCQVMRLWELYQEKLPLHVYTSKYEELVQDVESNAKAMLSHIGLAWQDDVLEFHRQDKNRFVSTPSYEGVMQPVYTGSIGRWKHYAKHFEPHLPKLQPFIKTFGYET